MTHITTKQNVYTWNQSQQQNESSNKKTNAHSQNL